MHCRFASFLLVLCSICATTLVSSHTAKAQTTAAPPEPVIVPVDASQKTLALQIDNKKGLVTVQDKEGTYLFAQVLTASKLRIALSNTDKATDLRITLSDESKKTLWQTVVIKRNRGFFHLDWTGKGEGLSVSTSPKAETDTETEEDPSEKLQGMVLIDNNDNPTYVDLLDNNRNGVHAQTVNNETVVYSYENGKKTEKARASVDIKTNNFLAKVNGKEYKWTKESDDTYSLRDGNGKMTVHFIERDGKPFTELIIGKRRIVFEGTSYNFQYDETGSVIEVKPPVSATP